MAAVTDTLKLFLAGDVMTARGIDAVLPHPGDPRLYEAYVKNAGDYVRLAERLNAYSFVGKLSPDLRFPIRLDHKLDLSIGRRESPAHFAALQGS